MTSSRLEMLEPTTLPTAMSELPRKAATTLVTSSGRQVPSATTVMPMMRSEMPRALAISTELSTTKSAPNLSIAMPSTTMIALRKARGSATGSASASSASASFSPAPSARPTTAVRTTKAANATSKMMPSTSVTCPPVLAKRASRAVAATLTGISKRCVLRESLTGAITAERPRMSSRLARQLPTTLPKAMSAWPPAAEVMLTTSSGREVPMATMVRPATRSGMPRRRAMLQAPSTRKLAPKTRRANPIAMMMRLRSTSVLSGSGLISHPVFHGPTALQSESRTDSQANP